MSRTVEELISFLGEAHQDEHSRFERVEKKLSGRPDLHAFLLLEMLTGPGDDDMVGAAEHDVIYLAVDLRKLANVATDEQLIELIRCGVLSSEEYESLMMFV